MCVNVITIMNCLIFTPSINPTFDTYLTPDMMTSQKPGHCEYIVEKVVHLFSKILEYIDIAFLL